MADFALAALGFDFARRLPLSPIFDLILLIEGGTDGPFHPGSRPRLVRRL